MPLDPDSKHWFLSVPYLAVKGSVFLTAWYLLLVNKAKLAVKAGLGWEVNS
jgi:hypothetical protein